MFTNSSIVYEMLFKMKTVWKMIDFNQFWIILKNKMFEYKYKTIWLNV